ncbi:MAG: 4-alpha-glucanotransferase [Deltaproteobacteria bacterium]|nr:4-alpha-glucanotransferase [Deltaproteobacteria bacterium]
MTSSAQPSPRERRAGVLVPLFSMRSARGWGIGEYPDIADLAAWLPDAGQSILQLLPLGETGTSETSPYGALTAFGLDPSYLALEEVEEVATAGVAATLGQEAARELERVRFAPRVQWAAVRRLKRHALGVAYERFRDGPYRAGGARARDFERFCSAERPWLEDHALFRALRDEHHEVAWSDWPAPLRDRAPGALAAARARLEDAVRYHEYVQWLCDTQLRAARVAVARHGVLLKGDLPFMVSGDSADVWGHREEFRCDVRLGAPPDQFSADGQDWGLPVYDWDAMTARGLSWVRHRAARSAALYDLFRLDHVVGFYRQFIIPPGARGSLVPAEEGAQVRLGEQVLRTMQEAAAAEQGSAARTLLTIVAEDLGVVPPYVRRSLLSLGIPGTKVMRWEKQWEGPGAGAFLDPAAYPELSLCTTGTHDTTTLAAWYEEMDEAERRALFALPALRDFAAVAGPRFTPEAHGAILGGVYGAASALCVLPIQDLLGARDRINIPSTVGPDNWVYRLPLTVDEMRRDHGVRTQVERVRRLCERHGRSAPRG